MLEEGNDVLPGNGRRIKHENDDDDDDDDGLLFSCRCESARSVTTLLSCLRRVSSTSSSSWLSGGSASDGLSGGASTQTGRRRRTGDHHGTDGGGGAGGSRAQHATVFAGPNGLTFHVHGVARQSQASVDMQAGLFSDYYVAEEVVPVHPNDDDDDGGGGGGDGSGPKTEVIQGGEFGINLTTVLECLHVLGTASLDRTKLCLSYDRATAIFKIELLEDAVVPGTASGGGGVLSTCAIPGMAVPDDEEGGASGLAVAFRSSSIVARAIVKSDFLRDAVAELHDVPGAASATVGVSPRGLEFAAAGHSGECHVSLPRAANADGSAFVSLECDPPRLHARSYPLASLLSGMRGLDIGCETCISMNGRGMIAVQHQVLDLVGNGQPNFVDFILSCIEDEEEDDGGDDENKSQEGQNAFSMMDADPPVDLSEVDDGNDGFELAAESARRAVAATASLSSSSRADEADGASSRPHRRRDEDDGTPCDGFSRSNGASGDSDTEDDDGGGGVPPGATAAPLFGTVADVGGRTSSRPNRREATSAAARRRRRGRESSQSSRNPPQDRTASSLEEEEGDSGARKRRSRTDSKSGEARQSSSRRKRRIEDGSASTSDVGSRSDRRSDISDEEGGSDDQEESLDVSADVPASLRSSLGEERRKANAGSPSSPQLMYGDTRLEHSEDDDGGYKRSFIIDSKRRLGFNRSDNPAPSGTYSDEDTDDEDF